MLPSHALALLVHGGLWPDLAGWWGVAVVVVVLLVVVVGTLVTVALVVVVMVLQIWFKDPLWIFRSPGGAGGSGIVCNPWGRTAWLKLYGGGAPGCCHPMPWSCLCKGGCGPTWQGGGQWQLWWLCWWWWCGDAGGGGGGSGGDGAANMVLGSLVDIPVPWCGWGVGHCLQLPGPYSLVKISGRVWGQA